ncbi:MAG: flavin reductase family protein [Halioglobus sp.]|nr:flavin reductase family protein [Halioglobus sp.]
MSLDGRELRDALGRFATGVCVITTVSSEQKAVGMTANSFSSVSLDPPLVLWSLQNNSDVYNVFAAPRHFAVNILSSEQQAYSNQYAKKGQHDLDPAHYRLGKYGAPIIRGALATFECELHATHEGGDHLIIVGRVTDMHQRPTGEPLLFYCGRYHELH